MGQLTIVYWRDIPAQVIVKSGRRTERRELDKRFMIAIDAAAMKDGSTETDAYLQEWRREGPVEIDGDLCSVADQQVARIDGEYDKQRLNTLIQNAGRA